MTLKRAHYRNTVFGIPDGTQGLQFNDRFDLGTAGIHLLRTRLQVELYVEAVSSTGNLVNFLAMTATRAVVASTLYDTPAEQGSSVYPITTPGGDPASLGWLTWTPMVPTVDYFKESDVETAIWTYRSEPAVIDVQTRRATTVGNDQTWWWSYEIAEDSGTAFLNQTVAGTTYALGYRAYWDLLYETL